MKVHQATLKKAEKNGVSLSALPDGTWSAEHKKSKKSKSNYDPKKALDAVLELVKNKKPEPKTENSILAKKDEVLSEVDKHIKSVVKAAYKASYKENGGNCGDALSKALKAAYDSNDKAFTKICQENGFDPKRWSHLNTGMQRMCLSNSLRGSFKHGIAVTVLGRSIKKT